jgi:hypothetical protein
MKVLYSACDITKTGLNFPEKLVRVFLPSGRAIGRLVKRSAKSSKCNVEIRREHLNPLRISFSNHIEKSDSPRVEIIGQKQWCEQSIEAVYIPVKEMLSNAPGFRSLYNQREVHFEEIYADILDRAYTPSVRGVPDETRKRIMSIIQEVIDGKVAIKNEEFFLQNKQGNLEFTLLAEGMRKLGLLLVLIQNGTLTNGSVLFWDEPETNLNPKLYKILVQIFLELQREGVQIFLATHDYVILKEFDLLKTQTDSVKYHTFYVDEDRKVRSNSTEDLDKLEPNAIMDSYSELYDLQIKKSLEPQ